MISVKLSLKWATASQIARVGFQFISVLILARILSPEDYGLIALSGTITAFAFLFRDFGTNVALIQIKDIDDKIISSVFTFNAATGLALTITIAITSSFFAHLYGNLELRPILLASSPLFLITGFSISPQAILERNSKYKAIFIADFLGGGIGLLAAIIAAKNNWGAFYLVILTITSALVSTVVLLIYCNQKFTIGLKNFDLSKVSKQSFNNFVFGLANYFHRNADSLLIGKHLGTHELGLYNTAYKILLLPVGHISTVIARVSLPAYSRYQSEPKEVAKHFTRTLRTVAFIAGPMTATIWALREYIVVLGLGEKWSETAFILAWLAPVGFIQSLTSISGTVFNALNRSDILRNLGLLGAPFFVASFVVGINFGVDGLAACYLIANIIWLGPVARKLSHVLQINVILIAQSVLAPTIISIALALLLRAAFTDGWFV